MHCHDFTELADRHIDDELGWWTRRQALHHLKICRYCRYFLGQLTMTRELLRDALEGEQAIPREDELVAAFARRYPTATKSG